jgi:hypothetical protein
MCRQFGNVILIWVMAFGLAAGQQQRPQPSAGSTPRSAQTGQGRLTDRDVIQMVESSKPEATIVGTIRSSRTNFDLSPQGCRLLAASHVSRTILNAMAAPGQQPCASIAGSSRPQTSSSGTLLGNGSPTLLGDGSVHAPSGGSRALNPQPLPPGTAAKSGAGNPGANAVQASAAESNPVNRASSVPNQGALSGAGPQASSPGSKVSLNPQPLPPKTSALVNRFDPAKNGFNFVNDFKNDFISALSITTGGLCGGMSYTALDYYFAHAGVPRQDFRPANGTVLQSYLYNRQVESIKSNLDKWSELGLNPGGARDSEFFNWGLQASKGGRLEELRSFLDNGTPVPLGLQGDGKTGTHQVVAIGYDLGRYKGDLGAFESDFKIFIYDPNHPNQTMTLVPDPANHIYHYQSGGSGETWRTYFVDKNYHAQRPPAISNPSYPKDGLLHEVVLQFLTGNDDLRGGSRIDLTINSFDGTQQHVPNINLGARWLDHYTENAAIVLARPVPVSQIRSLVLTGATGFASGSMGGDNWDMDQVVVQAYATGARQQPPLKTAGPFRFTGDHKELEISMNAAPPAAPGQVTQLLLRFQTGSDDLRGGNDNLNIDVHFADGTIQSMLNVNRSARWPDNTANTAAIVLNRAVSPAELKSLTLTTTFSGGTNGDNWNMNSLTVTAAGNGLNKQIGSFGFKRFTGDQKQLNVPLTP